MLLEHLAHRSAAERAFFAERLLAAEFADLSPEQREMARAEADRVFAMPESATVFGPDSLAEISAIIPGLDGRRMTGRIDRLLLGPRKALIVDIKTDRVPSTPG
jgi:ATP-dependent helicase/nuclease subunit A